MPDSTNGPENQPSIIYDFDPRNVPNEILRAIGLVTAAAAQTERILQTFIGALLKIDNIQGQRTTIEAGFGRWLMPNESSELRFPLPHALAPGEYSLNCEIETGGEPIRISQTISVSDLENAVSSSAKTAQK